MRQVSRFIPLFAAGLFCWLSVAEAAVTIPLTVNMSEPVNVTGTPQIAVDVDGQTGLFANFSDGSGTSTLTFTYTAQTGDLDLDGITLTSPIQLNGGTIKDLSGNDANRNFTLPNTSNVKVDYPSLSLDFTNGSAGRYTWNGNVYTSLTTLLAATGGSFTRTGTATYFDSTGTMQTAAANTPRFDYDPTTLVAKGMLFEETRTNTIRNSTMQGVAAPGTPPTNWSFCYIGGGATCTATITGTGTLQGMNYIDVRFVGNMPASGAYANIITMDSSGSMTVTNTDSATGQIRLALISGTQPSMSYIISEMNGGTYLTNRNFKTITAGTLTPTLTLYSGSAVAVNSSVNNLIQPRLTIGSIGSVYAYDFTLRVATPQTEKGGFPTSFIPTTTAAASRGADVLNISTSTWYQSSKGTFMAEFFYGNATLPGRVVGISGGAGPITANNANLPAQWRNWSGSGGPAATSPTTPSLSVSTKAAASWDDTDTGSRVSAGGSAVVTGTYTAGAYAGGTAYIGAASSAGFMLNACIKKLKYYPRRVSSTQLRILSQ